MAKIDLSGNSSWQGNEKIKSLETGSYAQTAIKIHAQNPDLNWIEEGTFAQIVKGSIVLKNEKEELIYEKNDMIDLEFLSNSGMEIIVKEITELVLFSEI